METRRWHTREDSGIRLDAEGRFWHDDDLIENPNVLRAFHQGLERDEHGRTLLRFGWDWCVIQVEDTPYQVLGLRIDGEHLLLRLDDGRELTLSSEALSVSVEGVLYARVIGRGGEMEARFSRAAQGQLTELLEEAPADFEGAPAGKQNARVVSGFALRLGGKLHVLNLRDGASARVPRPNVPAP
jgi:hypothetical protein